MEGEGGERVGDVCIGRGFLKVSKGFGGANEVIEGGVTSGIDMEA